MTCIGCIIRTLFVTIAQWRLDHSGLIAEFVLACELCRLDGVLDVCDSLLIALRDQDGSAVLQDALVVGFRFPDFRVAESYYSSYDFR